MSASKPPWVGTAHISEWVTGTTRSGCGRLWACHQSPTIFHHLRHAYIHLFTMPICRTSGHVTGTNVARTTPKASLLLRFRRQRHKSLRVLRLSRAQIGDDRCWIVPQRLGVGLADGTNLVHDGIGHAWDHVCSSSGVQIIGGRTPCHRHNDSSLARIRTLAMWAQFQVSRKSIP